MCGEEILSKNEWTIEQFWPDQIENIYTYSRYTFSNASGSEVRNVKTNFSKHVCLNWMISLWMNIFLCYIIFLEEEVVCTFLYKIFFFCIDILMRKVAKYVDWFFNDKMSGENMQIKFSLRGNLLTSNKPRNWGLLLAFFFNS